MYIVYQAEETILRRKGFHIHAGGYSFTSPWGPSACIWMVPGTVNPED